MSWYSDGEPCDERDPQPCKGCTRDYDEKHCTTCKRLRAMEKDEEEDDG